MTPFRRHSGYAALSASFHAEHRTRRLNDYIKSLRLFASEAWQKRAASGKENG